MKSKIVYSILLTLFFIISWFVGHTSDWKHSSGKSKIVEFEYLIRNNLGEYHIPMYTYKLFEKCTGFEGECDLDVLGIKFTLQFSGIKFSKPFFNFGFWGSGHSGWDFDNFYFGNRVLKITRLDGTNIGEFHQFLWNKNGYSDFSRIIFLDKKNDQIIISNKDGFIGVYETGFSVHF